jgi:YVTN family beta-propeller protein
MHKKTKKWNSIMIRSMSRIMTKTWPVLLLSMVLCRGLAAQDYNFEKEISIGGEGGWDILTIDSSARRLYLAHATKVVVVDIDAGKVVGEINDTPGVHAFQAVPELQRGFSSNGKENKAGVVDLKTLKTTSKVDTGESPDAIAYDAKHREVYVFNHRGSSVTVIDASSLKVTATIPLDGSPEFPVWDEAAGKVYCNIEDKSEVVAIDTAKHTVTATWPLAPGEEPSGIALDAAHHRLFAACRKLLVMADTETGKVVASVPIGNGADGCAFDSASGLVFVPCGEGLTTIAKEETPDRLTVVQTLKTQRGARTIALDPKTHSIFLPTAEFGPAPSPSPGERPGRPPILPGTQKLLVYGTKS